MTVPLFTGPIPNRLSSPSTFSADTDLYHVELGGVIDGMNSTAAAMNLNSTSDTSITSVLIGTGSKTFTVSTGKSYQVGMWILMANTAAPATNSMVGQVTSYTTGTGVLIVAVPSYGFLGSGTYTAWTITLTAQPSSAISGAMQPVTSAASLAAGRTALGSTTIGDALFVSATVAAVYAALGGTPSVFRNRVINGTMDVDQRNLGVAQTFTAAAALVYSVDRFYGYCTGANVTGQQITSGVDSRKRYRFTGATSNATTGFGHRIEAKNSVDMANTVCTLSVKLSSSTLTSVSWAVYYANTADTFGTLASPTRTSITSGTFTINSTEATYSTQVTVPSGATTGIEIVFSTGALVSAATLTYGDVQFEKGAIATAYVYPDIVDIGTNFSRCRRYHYRTTLSTRTYAAAAGLFNDCAIYFPTEMRVTPTTAYISGGAAGNISAEAITGLTTTGGRFSITFTAVGDAYAVDRLYAFAAEL